MRKASNVLFKVAGILSIICAVVLIPTSIVFLVLTAPECEEILVDMVKGTTTTVAELRSTLSSLGIWFIISGFGSIANAVLCFLARNRRSVAVYILNIIFGVVSSVVINIVAAILGLASMNRE